MSSLDRHNDPVVALTGGWGENAPIRWYRDKPATQISNAAGMRAAAVVSGVVWHYRNGGWVVAGERSAVA